MIERRLWQAIELIFLTLVSVVICLVVSLMVGGSSPVDSLVTLKELAWRISD